MPATPEEQPASFGESASLFGSGSAGYGYSAGEAAAGASAGAAFGGGSSLSPTPRQDSFSAPTGRTDSMWAAQPLRQESLARSDYSEAAAAGAAAAGSVSSPRGLPRQISGASAGHRRNLSTTSSGGMGGGGGGGGWDAGSADLGSMPGTPSRVEGPERAIVAGGSAAVGRLPCCVARAAGRQAGIRGGIPASHSACCH